MEQLQALWRTNRPAQDVPSDWLKLLGKLADQPSEKRPAQK